MFRFRLNPGRGQYHTRHRSWWDVSFYCHRPWQHHRNRENTIEICLLKVGGTSPITTRGAAQQKIILVLEPSNSAMSGVKISELSERKIAAEVPSFEPTPPSPDRRRMLARGN